MLRHARILIMACICASPAVQAQTHAPIAIPKLIHDNRVTTLVEAKPRPVANYETPNFEWVDHPTIVQSSPAGVSIAAWWTGNRPDWCQKILSWYQIFEAEPGPAPAPNTRVQFRNMRVYILWNEDRKWEQIENEVNPSYSDYWIYKFKPAKIPAETMAPPDGTAGLTYKPVAPYFVHGYGYTRSLLGPRTDKPEMSRSPSSVMAVYVTGQYRLIRHDLSKPDDRKNARYIVNVGADYYPGGTNPDGTPRVWMLGNQPAGYAPGVGAGRLKLATENWQTATMLIANENGFFNTVDQAHNYPPPGAYHE